ncbi:hypothetical protein BDA96_01G278900 [Sorghum bicolor]|uniref:Uncharacterized protein n=1 Tax=Sorghum bicolor TaxID=4558 RepID=A0A921S163_SORBI|nr:hypothetical protein BDA96_01G278900 [Sorghum bicolor]
MRQRRTGWLAAWVGRRHTDPGPPSRDPGPPPTVTSPCPLHTASPRQPRRIQRIQPRPWWFGPQPWRILRIWPQPCRLR